MPAVLKCDAPVRAEPFVVRVTFDLPGSWPGLLLFPNPVAERQVYLKDFRIVAIFVRHKVGLGAIVGDVFA